MFAPLHKILFSVFLCAPLFGAEVCFLAKHGGAIEHFQAFLKVCEKAHISAVLATDAPDLAAKILITAAADPCFASVNGNAHTHFLYYDNPESFVPGGYSENVARSLEHQVDGVIFANRHLVHGPEDYALGYYPLEDVTKLIEKRKQREQNGKPVLLYIGGANEVYYKEAFPHFLDLLSNSSISNCTLLFQQHPRAKYEGNRDLHVLESIIPKLNNIQVVVSDKPLLEAAVNADCILYSQSSAAPKFVLAKIPTIQVAKTPYPDILVRNGIIPCATTVSELERMESLTLETQDVERTLDALGVDPEWENNLITLLKRNLLTSSLKTRFKGNK